MQNAINFSIIAMTKKPNFTIFVIQNFVQNMKKDMWIPFILLGSCLKGKWILFSWLFPLPIYGFYPNNGTQLLHLEMQKICSLRWAFHGPLCHFFQDLKYLCQFEPWYLQKSVTTAKKVFSIVMQKMNMFCGVQWCLLLLVLNNQNIYSYHFILCLFIFWQAVQKVS